MPLEVIAPAAEKDGAHSEETDDELVGAMRALSLEDKTRRLARAAESEVMFTWWKPDFIRIAARRGKGAKKLIIEWQMIDAKASRQVKVSHQVQARPFSPPSAFLLHSLSR